MTKFLCGNLMISCPEKKLKLEHIKVLHLLQMTTLSICGKYLAVFERASIWLYWEVHLQISSFLGIRRMWGKKGEYLGEEELAQMASAQPSVWQLPCLFPECGLKSLF